MKCLCVCACIRRKEKDYSNGVDIAHNGSLMSNLCDGSGKGGRRFFFLTGMVESGRRFKDSNNKNIGYASHWSSTIVKY